MGAHGRPIGAPWAPHWRPIGAPWAPHGRPMGAPWAPMSLPWAPHGRPVGAPWAPMGAHGRPGAPHVLFLHGKTTKNIKNGLNGVEVAPFGLSLGRNGATGAPEPLALLPRPILGLFFFLGGFGPRGPGPSGPWDCPISPLKGQQGRCGVREAQFTLVYNSGQHHITLVSSIP